MQFSISSQHIKAGLIGTVVIAVLLALLHWMIGVAAALYGGIYYGYYLPNAYQYTLEDGRLHARIGLLTQTETTIDRDRVTDIHIERPWSDRSWGMASVIINTSGSGGAELKLEHIDEEIAEEVREQMYVSGSERRAARTPSGLVP